MDYKVALIILHDSQKMVLLQHRTNNAKLLPDHWAFFGGGLKPGETPRDAVYREAYEELNCKLKAPQLVLEQPFREGDTDGYLYIYTDFFDGDKDALRLCEGQGWGWFNETETGKLKMIDRDRQIIRYITQYLDGLDISSDNNKDNVLTRRLNLAAKEIRELIIDVACKSKSAHVGSSLSCADLLVSLYFHQLRIEERDWDNRDIFILSKAHAAMALYAVLTAKGFISRDVFDRYFQNDGTLPAHLDRFTAKGIEASAGSLGHGFNIALGMAYGYKLKNDKRKVFVLIGDGESQEGSIWEGALFASRLEIDNLTAILDYNNLQGYGRPTEICHYEPVADKWKAFGWEVFRVDGHNFTDIIASFQKPHNRKPRIIIADTRKGKGVPFMEDEMKWHYFIVTDEVREKAMRDLCERYYEECGR